MVGIFFRSLLVMLNVRANETAYGVKIRYKTKDDDYLFGYINW